MITQSLLDFFAAIVGSWLYGIPDAPDEYFDAIAAMGDSAATVAGWINKFGPVVPFDTVNLVLQWWAALVAFAAASLLVRLVLWAVNR